MDKDYDIARGQAISLQEMMARRDALEAELSAQSPAHYLVICQCNVPGPVKNWPALSHFFQVACEELMSALEESELAPRVLRFDADLPTGPLAILQIRRSSILAWELKRLLVDFEDAQPWRRLLDCDLRYNGMYISRGQIGCPPRSCLLCEAPAALCARAGTHCVEDLVREVERRLTLCRERGGQ